MKLTIDIQRAAAGEYEIPTDKALSAWISAGLEGRCDSVEVGVRIVEVDEAQALNLRYRGRDYATNVLSFPVAEMGEVSPRPLGDLVICAPVVAREAQQQGKASDAHWAHLCVHGVLHLLGFDHQEGADAREMESLEVAILARLGYQDPYRADA